MISEKRGRKKIVESIDQELVIKEKPVYVCIKCDRKFNRYAAAGTFVAENFSYHASFTIFSLFAGFQHKHNKY